MGGAVKGEVAERVAWLIEGCEWEEVEARGGDEDEEERTEAKEERVEEGRDCCWAVRSAWPSVLNGVLFILRCGGR